ncbi:MAG: histidinol-phosphate transaminase [Acidobacteria bacterium]|nr:MAG: histidinol-phosphate transaminase [Acidobacteriota bacterium]
MKRSAALAGVKKQVLEAPAYTLRAYVEGIKLNQNENPHDFPDDLKEEVWRRFRNRPWSRYPDFVPDGLRARLAAFAGWKKDGVLVGNGSNELLQATLMVVVNERASVAIPVPTFTVYGLVARVLGGRIVSIPLDAEMRYDVDQLIERSEEAAVRVLIVCTPNNPTGSVLEKRDLARILDHFSGYVLLDEAYHEFCGASGVEFLERYPRLLITRTFSKAIAMAGLRVGYLMGNPELVTQIAKAKLPYSVNQFSLTAAEVALDHIDRFRPAIDAILGERERLGAALGKLPGVKVYPSGGNFFLFELPVPPRAAFEELYRAGILVRDVSTYPMLSRCLRVSVGKPAENDRFLSALEQALARLAASPAQASNRRS